MLMIQYCLVGPPKKDQLSRGFGEFVDFMASTNAGDPVASVILVGSGDQLSRGFSEAMLQWKQGNGLVDSR
jgi:hypothetical protein